MPFDLPENWAWARLGDIGTFIRGNGIKRSEIHETGIPCIRYGEIYTTYNISLTKAQSFVCVDVAECTKSVNSGDLLFTLTGENKEEIGKTVAFLGDEWTVFGGDLASFTRHHQNPMYLSYLMNSHYAIQQKALLSKGNIIVHISCDKLAYIPVPVPPLAEQDRIVGKINELWALCEKIKSVDKAAILKLEPNLIHLPLKKQREVSEMELEMVARGDAHEGLSEQALRDVAELLEDDWDE